MRPHESQLDARTIFSRRRTAILCLLIVALVGGCHDETTPPPNDGLTLANSWPNQDGQMWEFGLTAAQWSTLSLTQFPPDVIFSTAMEVPPAPTLVGAATLLDVKFTGTPISSETAQYVIEFAGTTTTLSGATGQNLVASLDGGPLPAKGEREPVRAERFLMHVAAARPDLRERIEAYIGHPVIQEIDPLPKFLGEAAWAKTPDWIGTFGDLNAALAWIYLEKNLDIGHEFTLQLIPGLADDVYLHGRVQGAVTIENAAGKYEDALEVAYEVDYGVSTVSDADGNIVGFVRLFDVARVVYAAGVGPVESEERVFYAVGKQGVMGPWATLELSLQSTGRVEPAN